MFYLYFWKTQQSEVNKVYAIMKFLQINNKQYMSLSNSYKFSKFMSRLSNTTYGLDK